MLYLVLALVLTAFGLLITALTTANTLFAWISVAVSVIAAALLVLDWVRGRRRAREAVEPRTDSRASAPADTRNAALDDDLDDDLDVLDDDLDEPLEAEPDRRSARSEAPFSDQTPPLTETVSSRSEPPQHDQPMPAERERSEPAAEPEPDAPSQTDEADAVDEPAAAAADRPEPVEEPTREPFEEPARQRARQRVRQPAEEAGEPGEEQTDAADLLVVSDLQLEVRVVDEHPHYHLSSCTYLSDKPTLPLPVAEARQLGFVPCSRCGPDAVLARQHRAMR